MSPGIAVGRADILVGDAHRGREVAHAEHQAFQARRAGGDGVDVLHALDFLDQRLEADAALELQLLLELMQQLVGEQHVGRRHDLGHHDGVEMLAGALDHLDDVLEGVFGGEVVDAHAARLAPQSSAFSAWTIFLRASRFCARGDGVLEVEEDMVGLQLRLPSASSSRSSRAWRAGRGGRGADGRSWSSPQATILLGAQARDLGGTLQPTEFRYWSVCSPSKGRAMAHATGRLGHLDRDAGDLRSHGRGRDGAPQAPCRARRNAGRRRCRARR